MIQNRFERAVNALVKGYFNDTLGKGLCEVCAVGNIIAQSIGGVIVKIDMDNFICTPDNTQWTNVFCTVNKRQYSHSSNYYGNAKKQIDATGYSWQELAEVEKAFEMNTVFNLQGIKFLNLTKQELDKDRLNGLMAVVDVLCKIEGIEDSFQIKQKFEGKYEKVEN